MKTATSMGAGDDKFARFQAFEANRKAGKDDYTHNGPLQFVDRNEEENKKSEAGNAPRSAGPPPAVTPQSTAAVPASTPHSSLAEGEKKQVFYFDGEDMVKRDAMVQMVQLNDADEAKAGDNAEYPYLHVHTMGGEDVDPLTRQPVNIVHGYGQRDSFVQTQDDGSKPGDNAEYPYLHVHTQGGENVDPMTGEPVTIVHGYGQRDSFVQTQDDLAKFIG